MPVLKNESLQTIIFADVKIADTYFTRAKGLLGTKKLSDEQAILIKDCQWIHTFWMNFPIDCVYLDKNNRVIEIMEDIKPNRLPRPVWKACDVVEYRAGNPIRAKIRKGDIFYVGP